MPAKKNALSFPEFVYEPVVKWTTFKPTLLGGEQELTLPARKSLPGNVAKGLAQGDDTQLVQFLEEQGVPEEWANIMTTLTEADAEVFMREWFKDAEGHFLPKS